MGSTQMVWEDDDNNRQVALTVDYAVGDTEVRVTRITPTQVTFLCPASQSPLRSIRIWTDKGRALLTRAFQSSSAYERALSEMSDSLLPARVG